MTLTLTDRNVYALLMLILDDVGFKQGNACPVCSTITHKHWCWYPYLLAVLGYPLDRYDRGFIEAEKLYE